MCRAVAARYANIPKTIVTIFLEMCKECQAGKNSSDDLDESLEDPLQDIQDQDYYR
jgi:hypothetical protein